MDEILCTIKLFGGPFIPRGYLECNGQSITVNQYQAVYALLGNQYGGNLQQGTFALPKLTPPDEHTKYIICVEGVFPNRW
jgi:microcystin-dependent protein